MKGNTHGTKGNVPLVIYLACCVPFCSLVKVLFLMGLWGRRGVGNTFVLNSPML